MHRFCQYPRLSELLGREDLSPRVRVLAIGKAAWKMASVCVSKLNELGLDYEGCMLTKYGMAHGPLPGLKIMEAGHPLPDSNGLAYSASVVQWLKSIPARDSLLILLSGGASALFELLPDDMNTEDLARLNRDLLLSGKAIAEINRVRTEVSLVKGGKALRHVKSRHVHVYTVSDVEGNDPHLIGSGPFTPSERGQKTLDGWRFSLPGQVIRQHIVADNKSFCQMLASELKDQRYKVYCNDAFFSGAVGKFQDRIRSIFAQTGQRKHRLKQPFLQIWGGEIPIKVKGTGRGGRCSHLALSMAGTLSKHPSSALFCFATDGNDNIAGSGGSFSDCNTRAILRKAGIDYVAARNDNDSFTALSAIGNILPAPLISTNVNDVFVLSAGYDFEDPLPPSESYEYDIFEDHTLLGASR